MSIASSPEAQSIATYEEEFAREGIIFKTFEAEELYISAIRGKGGKIAEAALTFPLSLVTVKMVTEGSTFDFSGSIQFPHEEPLAEKSFRVPFIRSRKNPHVDTLQTMVQKLRNSEIVVEERGGSFIFQASNGTNLAMRAESGNHSNHIHFSTSKFRLYSQPEMSVAPSPELNLNNFTAALHDTCNMLYRLTGVAYDRAKRPIPEYPVLLSPDAIRKNKTNSTQVAPTQPEKVINISQRRDSEEETDQELLKRLNQPPLGITFEELGGQKAAVQKLGQLLLSVTHPEAFVRRGVRGPKGVLLHGPTGTGKTLAARAVASAAGIKYFLNVSTSDIVNMYYGNAEKKVSQVFRVANATGEPTIVFFDELDSLSGNREDGKTHEATQRIVGTFLQEMDGLTSSPKVIVLGTTNIIDKIDPAMKRPGRFDEWLEFTMPTQEELQSITGIHQKGAVDLSGGIEQYEEIDMEAISEAMDGFSGAEVADVIRRAGVAKAELDIAGIDTGPVSTADLLQAIEEYRQQRKMRKKFGFGVA